MRTEIRRTRLPMFAVAILLATAVVFPVNAQSVETGTVSVAPAEIAESAAAVASVDSPASDPSAAPQAVPDLSTLDSTPTQSSVSPTPDSPSEEEASTEPWDYSPYRVLVWIVSDDPRLNSQSLQRPLRTYLDRDFSSVWRLSVADAPAAVSSAARREIDAMSFATITAADPILAVKRDHPEAVRIRLASNVGDIVKKVYGTHDRIAEVKRRCAASGVASIYGVADKLEAVEGDALAVRDLWADEETEALLISRGIALTLADPEAKLVALPIDDLVINAIDSYDKIFVVRIDRDRIPSQVKVVELDTLMRHFGPVVTESVTSMEEMSVAVGRGLTRAFAPVVRIDNAGQKNAVGLIRAGGLILDENSPAYIRSDDVLEPMTRKNDRNGKPIQIGAIDWAFLYVTEPEIAVLQGAEAAGFKLGDQVARVSGRPAETPQRIEKALREHTAGEEFLVEVDRESGREKLAIDLSKTPTPLKLQYLGFTAGVRRGEVVVINVIPEGPAEGHLQADDVIETIGDSKAESINTLVTTIISTQPGQPIKLKIERGEASQDVTIEPSDISARSRRKDPTVEMDYYAGRAGGLQGRKNKRTFRMALKVRPFEDQTMVRLHARGDVDAPLIGYEIYEKEMKSSKMTFVGRTDWNGRLWLENTEETLRLMYVKNGGAVLARLPIVPGLVRNEVADIAGDDMRLQGEAYIRGVQNAIVDLIAIRELFAARIRLRLKKGEMKQAEELLYALRDQPTNEKLADDMGNKQDEFLKALGNRNANQRRKIDDMFVTTRELLTKHINPKMIRDLEADVLRAKENGGRLPEESDQDAESAGDAAVPPAAAPATDS